MAREIKPELFEEDTEVNDLAEQIFLLEQSIRRSTGQTPQGKTLRLNDVQSKLADVSLELDEGARRLNAGPRRTLRKSQT